MGILSKARQSSIERGYEYYKNKNILSFNPLNEDEYEAKVKGNDSTYDVKINIFHTSKCSCNCPFAYGNKKICKHMVALFFTVCPGEAKKYAKEKRQEYRKIQLELLELEKERKDKERRIVNYVNNLSKEQLRTQLINYMLEEDNPYEEDEEYYNELSFCNEYFDYEDIDDVALKLSTVVEGFDRIDQFNAVYINIYTNEIIEVNSLLSEQEIRVENKKIEMSSESYIALPLQYELETHKIIVDFIDDLDNQKQQVELSNAFSGKGAFKKFKNKLHQLGLEKKWYKFKENEYINKAKEFLIINDIDYVNDL